MFLTLLLARHGSRNLSSGRSLHRSSSSRPLVMPGRETRDPCFV
ncbi:hypothetical protein M8C21_014934, partial [Ambrosia artemisiifolia]